MRNRLFPAVLAATALSATGGAAFAIAGSVSTSPKPLYISQTSPGGLSNHPDAAAVDVRPLAAPSTTTDVTSTTTPRRSTSTSTSVPASTSTTTATVPDDHGRDGPRGTAATV